ncbi:MAG: adenylate kinase family protein [Minisyncoccota bacterium]
MNPQTFIFFGCSGSGKGTQGKLLTEYLEQNTPHKVLYIENGQRFREFVAKEKSFTSGLISEVMTKGGLMPESLSVWGWSNALVEHFTGNEHLLFDGVSRRAHEAPILHSALTFYKRKHPHIVYLNISPDRAFEMLKKRGRADDTDESIKRRLSWFEEHVVPAMNYFKHHDEFRFHEIDGTQSIEEVHQEIIKKIVTTE